MPEEQDKIVRRLTYIEKAEQEGQAGTPTTYQIGTEAKYVKYTNPNTQQETTIKNYLDNFSSEGFEGNIFNFNNDGSILTSHITQSDPNDPSTKVSTLVESPYKIGPDTEENSYAKLLKDFNALKSEVDTLKNKSFNIQNNTVSEFGFRFRYTITIDSAVSNILFSLDRNSYGLESITPPFINNILHVKIQNSILENTIIDKDINVYSNDSSSASLSTTGTKAGHYIKIQFSSNDINQLKITQGASPAQMAVTKENSFAGWIAGTFKGKTIENRDVKLLNSNLLDLFYPIGSIYTSTKYYHPATLFGGTWAPIKGRFLMGDMGDNNWNDGNAYSQPYRLGQTGGNTHYQKHSHSLTIPAKTTAGIVTGWTQKTLNIDNSGKGYDVLRKTSTLTKSTLTTYPSTTVTTADSGTGGSSNLPPYRVVYMWERIA